MKVTTVSIQGNSKLNEDALIHNESLHIYGVVDGATSLVPYLSERGETGGYLASRRIAETVNSKLSPPGEEPPSLLALFQEANAALADQMKQNGVDLDRKEELWTACAVMVRIHELGIDFAHAGDCMLVVYYEDGTIRVVTHDQLAPVDERTLRLWVKGMEEGLTNRDELRAYVIPQIVAGRQLANSPGGYGVLNGDPAFAHYAEYGRLSRANVRSLLLISDGLYIPKSLEAAAAPDALEIAKRVREGLQAYLDWLIALEESDSQCLRYPRFKKSDDKSAVWIDLRD